MVWCVLSVIANDRLAETREAEHRNDGLFSGQFPGHLMTLSLTLPIALTLSIEPILVLALPVLGCLNNIKVILFGIGSVSLRSH